MAFPITPAMLARDADEAVAAAKPYLAAGNAVVLKIQSPDIVHKSEVGGVRLNLTTEHACAKPRRTSSPGARAPSPMRASTASPYFP